MVKQRDDGWYFWDETLSGDYGPYQTKEQCEKELARYIKEFLNEDQREVEAYLEYEY
jgi:hypothetical protein